MASIHNSLSTLPQEMLDTVFHSLSLQDLARLAQVSTQMQAAVSGYVCSQLTQTAQHLPAGPLNLREVLCLDGNEPEGTPFTRANAAYGRLCAEWTQRGLDLQALPKGQPVRRADFEQIQQVAMSLQQDRALQLCWPRMHSKILVLHPPGIHSTPSQIRAFLNDAAHQEIISRVGHLNLSNLGLEVIPKELEKFSGLTSLFLYKNQFGAIPVTGLPAGLTGLSLEDNQITAIPEAGLPAGLQWISLSHNQIRVIPAGLPAGLQELYLSDNQITAIPVTDLPATLHDLFIRVNPLTEIPADPPAGLRIHY